jgi:hypothetical protein
VGDGDAMEARRRRGKRRRSVERRGRGDGERE